MYSTLKAVEQADSSDCSLFAFHCEHSRALCFKPKPPDIVQNSMKRARLDDAQTPLLLCMYVVGPKSIALTL